MLNFNKRMIKNRHGDTQSFELVEENQVLWRGCRNIHRESRLDDGTVIMVDPPGGPYLTTGSRLGWLYDDRGGEEFEHLVIEYFVEHPEGFMIVTRNEPI